RLARLGLGRAERRLDFLHRLLVPLLRRGRRSGRPGGQDTRDEREQDGQASHASVSVGFVPSSCLLGHYFFGGGGPTPGSASVVTAFVARSTARPGWGFVPAA